MNDTNARADAAYGWAESDDAFDDPSPYAVYVTARIAENLTELEALQLIFDNDFFKLVKAETNKYAKQSQNEAQRRKWKIVTVPEMKKFFAVILHMCLVK